MRLSCWFSFTQRLRYAGFVPKVRSDNLYGQTYGNLTFNSVHADPALADTYRSTKSLEMSPKKSPTRHGELPSIDSPSKVASYVSPYDHKVARRIDRVLQMNDDGVKSLGSQMPGYSGFIPSVYAENIFAETFARATKHGKSIADAYDPAAAAASHSEALHLCCADVGDVGDVKPFSRWDTQSVLPQEFVSTLVTICLHSLFALTLLCLVALLSFISISRRSMALTLQSHLRNGPLKSRFPEGPEALKKLRFGSNMALGDARLTTYATTYGATFTKESLQP